jgi:pimeloyl-ACP methyl ester carboxylesterase
MPPSTSTTGVDDRVASDDADQPHDFNEVDKRGHFAAWEQPELFTDEIRAAFRSLR